MGAIPGPLGNRISHAYALNNRGQVVGSTGDYVRSMAGLLQVQAFVWQSGHMRTLGGGSVEAYGINDRGWIVGRQSFKAFLYRNGRFETLGPLGRRSGGNASKAMETSSRGEVVGGTTIPQPGVRSGWDSRGPSIVVHAFLWRHGRLRDLGAPKDEPGSLATAINDNGQVVGYTGRSSNWIEVSPEGPGHAVLWDRLRIRRLRSLPQATESRANSMNTGATSSGRPGAVRSSGAAAASTTSTSASPGAPAGRSLKPMESTGRAPSWARAVGTAWQARRPSCCSQGKQ